MLERQKRWRARSADGQGRESFSDGVENAFTNSIDAAVSEDGKKTPDPLHAADVADILTQLGSSPDLWQFRLERLRNTTRLFGVAFATKRLGLEEMATARGVSKLANIHNCSGMSSSAMTVSRGSDGR